MSPTGPTVATTAAGATVVTAARLDKTDVEDVDDVVDVVFGEYDHDHSGELAYTEFVRFAQVRASLSPAARRLSLSFASLKSAERKTHQGVGPQGYLVVCAGPMPRLKPDRFGNFSAPVFNAVGDP